MCGALYASTLCLFAFMHVVRFLLMRSYVVMCMRMHLGCFRIQWYDVENRYERVVLLFFCMVLHTFSKLLTPFVCDM